LPFRQRRTASHTCFGVVPAGIGTVCLHHPEYPALLKAQSALGASTFGGGDPTARFVENRSSATRASGQAVIRRLFFKDSSVFCGARDSRAEIGLIFSRSSLDSIGIVTYRNSVKVTNPSEKEETLRMKADV
jgi:hypothetical protein